MKKNVFQIGLLIGFGLLTALGFGFFAFYESPNDAEDHVGDVVIWGTVSRDIMEEALIALDDVLPKGYEGTVAYKEKDERTFNEVLVDALAAGEGPDLFLLRQGDIVKHLNKIFIIPYESYTERRFKDTYIEGGEIYLSNEGVLALPFIVDPLIMFWNRDILAREGVATTPENWSEFFLLSPKLTKRDSSANILLATVPFGEYRNVTNAKEIISALIMQADNPISYRNPTTNDLTISLQTLNSGREDEPSPTEAALRYYTEFSNPVKSVYSWNRALNESRRTFLSGDLAFYFGFASEISELRKANPNLNFDIAVLPQIKDDLTPATFGNMQALAVVGSTDNFAGSVRVAALLSTNSVLAVVQEFTLLPPVTRSLLSNQQVDDIQPILYESALISAAWLEPDREKVDTAFRDMIESISSGRLRINEAIGEAQTELTNLLK